jgi:1-phosphofructokinase
MRSFLQKHGVKSDFIHVYGSNRICLLINEQKAKTETIINSESNFKIFHRDISALLEKIKKLSSKASFVVLSGSLPLSLPENFYQAVIKSVAKNSRVLLDTSSRYLFHGVKASPYIIKQNIHELESAFKVNFGHDFYSLSAKRKLKSFLSAISGRYGIPVIIVTLGSSGSALFDKGAVTYSPANSAKKIISPVGCGDAFTAGLVHGLSKNWPMPRAMKLASCCAAANLSHMGSCFFRKKDVQLYFKEAI